MDIVESNTLWAQIVAHTVTSLSAFATVVIAAISKIIFVILGILMVFILIPQTRTASNFLSAVVGAFTGGVLIQMYTFDHVDLKQTAVFAVCLGLGIFLVPFFILFRQIYALFAADQELAATIYGGLRTFFFSWFNFFVRKVSKKDTL